MWLKSSVLFGFIFFMIWGCVSVSAKLENCPEDFTKINNKCYKFVDKYKTWFEANNYCSKLNAKLLVTGNQMYMNDFRMLSTTMEDTYWMANIRDVDNDEISYSGMGSDEPMKSTYEIGYCSVLRFYYYHPLLGSEHCNELFKFICEMNSLSDKNCAEKGILINGKCHFVNVVDDDETVDENEIVKSNEKYCGEGFTLFGDKCYIFKTGRQDSWHSALAKCTDLDASLVTINNAYEMKFINNHLDNLGYRKEQYDDGFWILPGKRSITYSLWAPGEPNNFDGQEQCINLVYIDNKHYMNDYSCDKAGNFICEKMAETSEKANKSEQEVIKSKGSSCPKDFQLVGNKCYYIEERRKNNWFSAQRNCMELNANLASIENEKEMIFVSHALINLGFKGPTLTEGFWTSGNDLGNEGDFIWQNNGNPLSYAKWYEGEPNNFNQEDCIQLRYIKGSYYINDSKCSNNNLFICETKAQLKTSIGLASSVNECKFVGK